MRGNNNDEKRVFKKEDNKRKKIKHGNLNDNEKEQLMKYEKKERKVCVITLMKNKKNN